jgi:hypothetical protein
MLLKFATFPALATLTPDKARKTGKNKEAISKEI